MSVESGVEPVAEQYESQLPTGTPVDELDVETDDVEAFFDDTAISGRQLSAVTDAFDSVTELLTEYAEGGDFTEYSGVGDRTARRITDVVQERYPGLRYVRVRNDEGICSTFTADHGIAEDEQDDGEFYFAFICPRCGSRNDMQGDPDGFANRPYACVECRWVSLMFGEAVERFREEAYPDSE